ncbi:hypothetical protein [Jidongwangia harbinensis]|uniref:hypothetical protein n=1 Tax=Jidongwangia harbinensis TaxID=2878561 RepID=UPI001CD94CBC|nr:hypothetical protein [Jidongwangia harbinensis]MCA2212901.1 hypothetical protein [Jidongwangia harbinensis]
MPIVVPDACTLPTADQPLRLAEFDALFATAVRHVETVAPTHARMRLTGPDGLAATVRDLTARETECCSFFTFTVTPGPADDGESLLLDIEVPAGYVDVLDALVGRAGALSTGTWPADDRSDGDRTGAMRFPADAVHARLSTVQDRLNEQLRLATEHGPGTAGWLAATKASVPLTEEAARLQSVAAALTATPQAGPGDDAGDRTAAQTMPGAVYTFPAGPVAGAPPPACDLAADGGEAVDRIDVWQRVLARVQGRDRLDDSDTGLALRFPLEIDLAATLARLAAAEYRCCSFGSYTIVIDDAGLRLEVRMPEGAADTMAAVLGRPDRNSPEAAR